MSFRVLVVILLVLTAGPTMAQTSDSEDAASMFVQYDRLYGLNQELINGVRYIPEFPGSKGHQFLDDIHFSTGSLRMGANQYEGINLAYNIHRQQLLLRYENLTGALDQIILRNRHIEEFSLGSRHFEKKMLEGQPDLFYQVIRSGQISCYYHWYKVLNQSTTGESFYLFSDAKRRFYLEMDGQIHRFKNKGQFVKIFEEKHQKAIRNHFRENKIILKQVNDRKMSGLIEFCNYLIEE